MRMRRISYELMVNMLQQMYEASLALTSVFNLAAKAVGTSVPI